MYCNDNNNMQRVIIVNVRIRGTVEGLNFLDFISTSVC